MLLPLHGALIVLLVTVAEHIQYWNGRFGNFSRLVWLVAVEADDVKRDIGTSICGGKGLDSSSATSTFMSSDPSKVDEKFDLRSSYVP